MENGGKEQVIEAQVVLGILYHTQYANSKNAQKGTSYSACVMRDKHKWCDK